MSWPKTTERRRGTLQGTPAAPRPSPLHATYLPGQWPWPSQAGRPPAARPRERPERTTGPPGRRPPTGRASASPLWAVAAAVKHSHSRRRARASRRCRPERRHRRRHSLGGRTPLPAPPAAQPGLTSTRWAAAAACVVAVERAESTQRLKSLQPAQALPPPLPQAALVAAPPVPPQPPPRRGRWQPPPALVEVRSSPRLRSPPLVTLPPRSWHPSQPADVASAGTAAAQPVAAPPPPVTAPTAAAATGAAAAVAHGAVAPHAIPAGVATAGRATMTASIPHGRWQPAEPPALAPCAAPVGAGGNQRTSAAEEGERRQEEAVTAVKRGESRASRPALLEKETAAHGPGRELPPAGSPPPVAAAKQGAAKGKHNREQNRP